MRVSAYVSVAVFSTAAISAVHPLKVTRQIDVITGILSDVGDSIGDVDSAVTAYDGSDPGPLVDAGNDLVSTINSGVTTAQGSDDLSLEAALGLQSPVSDLTDQAGNLVDNLTSKRDIIAENGECGRTRDLVNDISTSSNRLIDVIVSKVPEEAQSIAQVLASDLQAVLRRAQDNFSESNCVDSGNGGGSGTTNPPTQEPTSEPTGQSTEEPTGEPTGEPTEEPTGEPTEEPTEVPTGYPTGVPTGAPTGSPTVVQPPPGGNSTETGVITVPTAGAGALLAPGVIAVGIAVALL